MIVDTGGPTTADERRRLWAGNLKQTLKAQGLTVKVFHRHLYENGLDISIQSIYLWLNGATSPSPESQAVVAKTLGQSAAVLFPVQVAS